MPEALEWARTLDEQYGAAEDGAGQRQQRPPLFGLPFSVKDNIAVKGHDSTVGCAYRLNAPAKEDSTFVEHLKSLGAVPFCHTNLPQGLLSYTCSNPIYGTTENPHKIGRTPGGSTGGECALTASGANAFGIGTDIAGSLRIPAHCSGVVTLKPTSGRLKIIGCAESAPGQGRLGMGYGFLTRDCTVQRTLWEAFLTEQYFTKVPQTVPLAFGTRSQDDDDSGPLRVGYFVNDGFFEAVPACQRAVRETVEHLTAAGHTVVPFSVPTPQLAAALVQKCMLADNGSFFASAFKDAEVDRYMRRTAMALKTPFFLRRLAAWAFATYCPQLATLAGAYVRDLIDMRDTFAAVDTYRLAFIKQWQDLELDCLVCPGFPMPAVPHEYPAQLPSVLLSTGLFNLIDFPAGSLPVTKVTAEDDEQLARYQSDSSNPLYQLVRTAAADSQGLPVGVQVVGLPYQEERCLHLMRVIERQAAYQPLNEEQ